MKTLILIFLLAVPFFMKAQAPGYQGKHFLLSYNAGFGCNGINAFPRSFSSVQQEDVSLKVPFMIFMNHTFQAEYILSRHFGLEAEFSYLNNSGFEKDSANQVYGHVNVEASGFGLNFVFYTGDNSTTAPVGNFIKIRTFTKSYKAMGFVYVPMNYPDPAILLATTPHTGSGFGLGLEIGHHQIAWNHVLFNISVCSEYSFLTPSVDSFVGRNVNIEVTRHLTSAYLAYFKFGVGGLLF
jgi:hypothetical protein